MRKNDKLKPIAAAMGAAVVATLATLPAAQAADNPFGMTQLSSGYMVADAHKDSEGKCGGAKDKEGKCGGAKDSEGKCGGAKDKEGKCGGAKEKEGKCGEGKCGGSK